MRSRRLSVLVTSLTFAATLSGGTLAWKKHGAGCPPRFAFTAVWDSKDERVLVYAGETKKGEQFDVLKDLWSCDPKGDVWKQIETKGDDPGDRAYHSAVFDDKRGVMWVFGGAGRSFEAFDDLWKFDVAASMWTRLQPTGERPGARFDAGFFYDAKRDQLVLWSGCKAFFKDDNAWPDLWRYDISKNTWTKSAVAAPPRWQAASVLAPELDVVIAHGGYDGKSVVRGETWLCQLETDKWTDLGKGFKATDAHQAVWDRVAQQMIVHGGATGAKLGLNEMWAFDPKKKKWSQLAWKGDDPGGRGYHAAVWLPKDQGIWVFGGTQNQFMDELKSNEAWSVKLHP